jgi:hypothetical protein
MLIMITPDFVRVADDSGANRTQARFSRLIGPRRSLSKRTSTASLLRAGLLEAPRGAHNRGPL